MKQSLFKISAVAIAIVFLWTSFAFANGQINHTSYSNGLMNSSVTPSVQTNNSSACHVKNGTANKITGFQKSSEIKTNSNTNISVGEFPVGVAIDTSNGYIYITNSGSNSTSVINGSTNAVIATVNVGYAPQGGVTYDPENNYYNVS